jgi:O-antigen ligase
MNRQFPPIIRRLQNVFVFLLAFPFIDVLGNSLYFYILLLLIFYHYKYHIPFINFDNTAILFFLLFITGMLSTVFHPYVQRHPGNLFIFNTVFHFLYWVIIALYFKTQYSTLNWKKIDQYIFYGVISLIIGFYLLSYKTSNSYFNITTQLTRNSFVLNLLCFTPFAMRHAFTSYKKVGVIIFIMVIFIAMMLSNGRAGGGIMLGELFFLFLFIFKRWYKVLRIALVLIIPSLLVIQNISIQPALINFSYRIEKLNPRFGELLRGEGEGDLDTDKSWLLRKLMVDKSIEIFKDYPLFGIGWFNFTNYDSELYTISNYPRLGSKSTSFYNTRSAHNSYAQYLAECGIVGALLMFLILIRPVYFTLKKFILNRQLVSHIPLISLLAMLTHFYVIAAMYGANTWFIIGIAYGIMQADKKK